MREYLSAETLFNTVAMVIKESSALLLVAEGDDDHFVLKRHVSEDLSVIAGIGGREHVLRAAAIARRRNLRGVKFLVDRDIDDYCGKDSAADNVVVSDRHDIMTDLLFSSGMTHRVVEIHIRAVSRQSKPGTVLLPTTEEIVDSAIELATLVAATRIASARDALSLDFARFSFGALSENQFTLGAVTDILLERNQREDVATAFSEASASALEELKLSRESVVGDHDLFRALARVLKVHGVHVADRSLFNSFLAGVNCAVLLTTNWLTEIESWCNSNSRRGFTCYLSPV